MSPLSVRLPVDEDAEQRLAAVAVASLFGAGIAARRVSPEDFYAPRWARVFEAAVACELTGRARVEAVAAATGETVGYLDALDGLPRFAECDDRGSYARLVREVADRRRRVLALLAELEAVAA